MKRSTSSSLNRKRAIGTFVLAYVAVTILGIALSLACSAILHAPDTVEPMQNAGYLLSERFFPGMNLLVWMSCAWIYFRSRPQVSREEAWRLGIFWLAIALVVDFVGFVLIKNPISLSPHDFYIGQFPWIYLIYVAILISPVSYVAISNAAKRRHIS
jgi:hypothetical protein